LRIVARLCEEGPLSITRLTAGAAVSRQAITKHLHALEEAGLARVSRAGRESVWELRTHDFASVQRYLIRYRGSGTRRSIDSAPWWKMRGRRYENRIAPKENAHRRDFMFVAPPLPINGAVGSPINPQAIK